MRKALLTALLSLCLAPLAQAITVVQTSSGNGYNPTRFTLSFSTLPSRGDAVIVALCFKGGGAQPGMTVTDNQGNTYTQVVTGTWTGVSDAEIWWSPNIGTPSGVFTLTVTPATYSTWSVGLMDVAGLSSTVDKSGSFFTTGSTTPSVTASGANSNANDLVVATYCNPGLPTPRGVSHPAASGYTDFNYNDYSSPTNIASADGAYKIVSALQTSSAAWTVTSADGGSAAIASFEASSGGATCTNAGYTQAGTMSVPTAGVTSVYRQDGTWGTVTCASGGGASNSYYQQAGVFGSN